MDSRLLSLIESVIASLSILLLSAFTVPFVGGMMGVSITATQGFGMGVVFFLWAGCFVVRYPKNF